MALAPRARRAVRRLVLEVLEQPPAEADLSPPLQFQLPTAIFSFSYGSIKILVLLGKATKMVLSKFNDAKSKIAQIVPEGQVQAQTDDNAAVKGAPTVTIEVNAQAMAEEKMKEKLQEKIDEKKDEAMEKLDKKLEEKMTKKKKEDEETEGEEI